MLTDLLPPKTLYYQDTRYINFCVGEYNRESNLPLLTVQFGLDDQVMNFVRIKQTLPEVFSIIGGLLGFVLAFTRAHDHHK
jgi:hypothetical protein